MIASALTPAANDESAEWLASILGAVIELRLELAGLAGCGGVAGCGVRWVRRLMTGWGIWVGSAWREGEAELAVLPPGDGQVEVGEATSDEDGVVAAEVECAGDVVVGDVQGAGGVQEVPPELVGGGVGVAGQAAG